jgi:23S rRNA (uridine2552-2'-O)-methyltransferase
LEGSTLSNYEKADHWTLRARKEGYPARSVYKLQELDARFGLLPKAASVSGAGAFRALDLGAAPGSWSLYVLRRLAGRGFLAACDLAPLSAVHGQDLFGGGNFFFMRADLFAPDTRSALSAKGPYSLILSDAAPATSGGRLVDAARSLDLAEAALAYAGQSLKAGGSVCVKVFQGDGTAALIRDARARFASLRAVKPAACRPSSFELYLVGTGFKRD